MRLARTFRTRLIPNRAAISTIPSTKRFIDAAARLLKANGILAIEHTEDQGDAISAILQEDFLDIKLHKDLTGRPRWTSATRKNHGI